MCWLILGQLEPMGHGNTLIMNIQAQPLEETAARVMSHVLTVVRGHFLGLLEDCISKREREMTEIYTCNVPLLSFSVILSHISCRLNCENNVGFFGRI